MKRNWIMVSTRTTSGAATPTKLRKSGLPRFGRLGMKIPRQFNEHTALRAFTSANIKDAGNPPKLSTGYGNAYEKGYKKLWGIK